MRLAVCMYVRVCCTYSLAAAAVCSVRQHGTPHIYGKGWALHDRPETACMHKRAAIRMGLYCTSLSRLTPVIILGVLLLPALLPMYSMGGAALRCAGHRCLPVQLTPHSDASPHACPSILLLLLRSFAPCACRKVSGHNWVGAMRMHHAAAGGRYNRWPAEPRACMLQRTRFRMSAQTYASQACLLLSLSAALPGKSPALPQLTFRTCQEPRGGCKPL